jgi:bile acid-coenzyme A ligase
LAVAKPKKIIGAGDANGERRWIDDRAYVAEQFDPAPLASKAARSWKAIASGGSTGLPKLIVTHAPALTDPLSAGYALQRPEDTVLIPSPLYHNAAFSAAHHALFAGGHVVNMTKFDAEHALQLIDRHRVTHVVFVPTMMNRIWRLPPEVRNRYDLSSLRVVLHLGAPCPIWLKEQWIDWLGPDRLFEVYAGTEGVGATLISGREWLTHRGSVGRPARGAEMKILDDDGHPCATGEVGEIYFRPDPARGDFHYLGADARRRGDWVSLGDLGRVDGEGYLYLADRRTDMIVSGGVNLYPAEIEAAIERHPEVVASVVVGLPDDDLGQRAHAIVQVPPSASALNQDRLVEFLKEQTVRYKIPRSFEFVTHALRDEAGKARRSQLRAECLSIMGASQ